jgi:hypothetical protein
VIHHIVLFRFAEDTAPAQISDAADALRAMRGSIPDVRAVSFGPNLGPSSGEWPHVLIVAVDDMAAVGRYSAHPVHLDIVARFITPIRDARLAVDVDAGHDVHVGT